jgi:AmmeMemoRadiSam system protein A
MMRGETLLSVARRTLEECFGGAQVERPSDEAWLDEKRAVFVTLTKHGELRGCVGQLEPRLSLFDAVRDAAKSAAFRDDRFPPLQRHELAELHLEISVLSPLEHLDVHSEQEALAKLRPGVDGLVLTWGAHRGVFIPEVWKQLKEPSEFLYALKRKAGLRTDTWMWGTQLDRFTAEVWDEPTLSGPANVAAAAGHTSAPRSPP